MYNYSAWTYTSGSLGRGSTKSMTTDALQDAFAITSEIDDHILQYAFKGCTGLTGSVSFPKLSSIGPSGLYYTFNNCTNLSSVSFPKLTTVDGYGLYYTFNGCTGLTGSVSFPELTTVYSSGLSSAFEGCTGLTSVDFPELTTVYSYGLFSAFKGCTGLTSVSFPKLTTLQSIGLYYAFYGCTGLTSVSFPKLTTISSQGLYDVFIGCTNLKEVHFHYSLEGNSECTAENLGCSNATIYFDLGCTVAPSGRRYYRHSSGMGSVMIWDDNGTRRETLILDMQYHNVKKYWSDGDSNISGITDYITRPFKEQSDTFFYILGSSNITPSDYDGQTDAVLDAKFNWRDEHTSKENTDALISAYPSSNYAANFCRSITVNGVGCDLPNMQTLVRIFCDRATIHSLDATDISITQPTGTIAYGWTSWFIYGGACWSSSEFNYNDAWSLDEYGELDYSDGKDSLYYVIPTLDIS